VRSTTPSRTGGTQPGIPVQGASGPSGVDSNDDGVAHDGRVPGVLYFDPNPTTARLATAGLRLAGYVVYVVSTQQQAVDVCRKHGPGGDGNIVALLLDTATSPATSASVLKALVQVPGAAELPGILLVSRANPTPIPGAESLPSIKRPFTTPALLKVLRETIEAGPPSPVSVGQGVGEELLARIELTLAEHFPELDVDRRALRGFTSALVSLSEVPSPAAGVAFVADMQTTRFEAILAMLDESGARGILEVVRDDVRGRLHIDRGRVRLAEIQGTDEDLRIGRFVVEAGFMDPQALEAVANEPDAQRRMLGRRLVEDGHLRRAELNRVLINQALEITCYLLHWKRGRATFSPLDELHPLAAAARGRTELRIAETLLEGLRRTEQGAEMGPHMPGVEDIYIRNDQQVGQMGRHAFTQNELAVLELMNGRNSVKDIARKTRTGTFAVSTVIYRLGLSGLTRRRMTPMEV
jgi:CheY-like chemotaxis protein